MVYETLTGKEVSWIALKIRLLFGLHADLDYHMRGRMTRPLIVYSPRQTDFHSLPIEVYDTLGRPLLSCHCYETFRYENGGDPRT